MFTLISAAAFAHAYFLSRATRLVRARPSARVVGEENSVAVLV